MTNRKKLSAFFHLINDNIGNIDLVVVDIGFELETGIDSVLKQELLKLYAADKLLLSIEPDSKKNKVLDFNERIYGNIMEIGNEKLFVSHTIKYKNYYSLPYKLYAHLNKLETRESFFLNSFLREINAKEHRAQTIFNTFFPEFLLTDEELLKGHLPFKQNPLILMQMRNMKVKTIATTT